MNHTLSVSELTLAIKKQLEGNFPLVCVKGEISNFKEQSSGHLYFTLKDAEAQISAVLFRGNTRGLARLPKSGDQVVVKGEISVYAPRGNYQLIIREMNFAGVGELLLKLHELKLKLEAKGWFESSRKKQLPKFPRTIGVITSPTGAVIQDILNILNRRFSNVHLILNPVKVQGDGAAGEIAQAIDQFNHHNLADVLIVGRGGGSLEDLWAFNEEIVADAIFRSKIPIISAVGHETDFSLSDAVADVRAPTPSAAAEIVVSEKKAHLQYLSQIRSRIDHHVMREISVRKQALAAASKQPILSSPYAVLGQASQRLDDLSSQLTAALRHLLVSKKVELSGFAKRLEVIKPTQQVRQLREKLARLTAHLKAIDPKNLLTKGYSIVFHETNDSIILSSKNVADGESIRVLMQDGSIKAKVYDI